MSRLRHLAIKLRKIIKWRTADALFAAGLGSALHRSRPGGRIVVYHGFDSWVLGGKSFDPGTPIEALRCTYGDLDTF